jgi:hypothetical protein
VPPRALMEAMTTVALATCGHRRQLTQRTDPLRSCDPVDPRLYAGRGAHLVGGHFDRQLRASDVSNREEVAVQSVSRFAESTINRFVRVPTAGFSHTPPDLGLPEPTNQRCTVIPFDLAVIAKADLEGFDKPVARWRLPPPGKVPALRLPQTEPIGHAPRLHAGAQNPPNLITYQRRVREWVTQLCCTSGEDRVKPFPPDVANRHTVWTSMTSVARCLYRKA